MSFATSHMMKGCTQPSVVIDFAPRACGTRIARMLMHHHEQSYFAVDMHKFDYVDETYYTTHNTIQLLSSREVEHIRGEVQIDEVEFPVILLVRDMDAIAHKHPYAMHFVRKCTKDPLDARNPVQSGPGTWYQFKTQDMWPEEDGTKLPARFMWIHVHPADIDRFDGYVCC